MNSRVAQVQADGPAFSPKDRAVILAHFRAIQFLHKKCGNTFSVSRTLAFLYIALMNMESKPVYLKDVADMLGSCMPAASRLLIRFLASDVTAQIGYGLIEQVPDYFDRRRLQLRLTQKGWDLIASYLDKATDGEARLAGPWQAA